MPFIVRRQFRVECELGCETKEAPKTRMAPAAALGASRRMQVLSCTLLFFSRFPVGALSYNFMHIGNVKVNRR